MAEPTSQNPAPGRFASWIFPCLLAFVPTMATTYLFVVAFVILPIFQIALFAPYVVTITVFAMLQRRLVRRLCPVSTSFVAATTLAVILASILISLPLVTGFIDHWLVCYPQDTSFLLCSELAATAAYIATGLVIGTSSGFGQWLALQRHIPPPTRLGWWIPANAVAVALASASMQALPRLPALRDASLMLLQPALLFVALALVLFLPMRGILTQLATMKTAA